MNTSATPVLGLVLDRATPHGDDEGAIADAVRAGVDWIQLRDRALDGAALFAWTQRISDAARAAAQEARRPLHIVVNRRADVALAGDADGVHLGFDALRVADARRLLGERALIGVSAHAENEIARAADEGASYAHLAPIFPPLSKAATRPSLGVDALGNAAAFGIPVLAQGGIDANNAADAIAAGAAGVAVTGAILLAEDPAEATRRLREALDG